ncbi:MAG: MFS transporter [Bacteroidaceae bacterium]|nr:MFS transporter [Bacteroidaceae bacterium]
MIYRNGKEMVAASLGNRAIAAIYRGARLVWMAVRSCFGSGVWVGKKPWIGKEKWKGHK